MSKTDYYYRYEFEDGSIKETKDYLPLDMPGCIGNSLVIEGESTIDCMKAFVELYKPTPRQNGFCDCPDIIVLCKDNDIAFRAKEIFCPRHGYQNDCYVCHPELINTELCLFHTGAKR